jgi:hypothetical protein
MKYIINIRDVLIFGEMFVAREFEDPRSRPCSDGGDLECLCQMGGGGRPLLWLGSC